VHWDGLFGAFKAGPPQPYQDATLLKLLDESGVQLVVPLQYMDRWRLDRNGIRAMENSRIKQVLGFR
jgi:hypothetical protein